MKIGSSTLDLLENLQDEHGVGLTIGNFDGVHKGHASLLKGFVEDCKNYNLKSLVLTFDPHPRHILNPRDPYAIRLFSIDDLAKQMDNNGVDLLWIQKFDLELAELTAESFINKFLKSIPVKFLLVGHDFRFGKQRAGRIEDLLTWCETQKIPLKIFSPFEVDKERVSSTLIKNALLDGNLDKVSNLLGRRYFVEGKVAEGFKRGQGIGFPTANLDRSVPLKNGVYATALKYGNRKYKAITNVGLRPTVNNNLDLWNKNIETHVPGHSLELYGKVIEVEFYEFIREEIKFESLEDLKSQIKLDLGALEKINIIT